MKRALLYIIVLQQVLVSCDYFGPDAEKVVYARVNNSYLYKEDIEKLIPENTTPEDSVLMVHNYINRWATKELLIEKAKINIPSERIVEFDRLIHEYQNDLLTEAYKDLIVTKQLDTVISEQEYREYYEENKDNFKLNDILIKMRYLQLPTNYSGLNEVKEKFNRYNDKDKADIKRMEIQFQSSNLNDSVWIRKELLWQILPVLQEKESEVLKKSNFTQLQDSLGVYLVKTKEILNANDTAPLSFIKPTVGQIILNKRKLELIKKLETDITKDAIKTNNFEIYKNE